MSEKDGLWELPYDPEFETGVLRALGWMVVQSNMLEHAVGDLYWVASGKSWDDARDDIRDKTLGPLANFVTQEFERRFSSGDVRQRFETVKADLKKAIDTRNQFVHAEWSFDHAKRQMHRRRLPRGQAGIREYLHFSVPDIEAASHFVGGVAATLWEEVYDHAVRSLRPPKATKSA